MHRSLSLLLALASNDLDFLGFNIVGIIQLELDVLDDERPDLVTEAVGVEVSLHQFVSTCCAYDFHTQPSYFERHPGLHFVPKHGCYALIEVL